MTTQNLENLTLNLNNNNTKEIEMNAQNLLETMKSQSNFEINYQNAYHAWTDGCKSHREKAEIMTQIESFYRKLRKDEYETGKLGNHAKELLVSGTIPFVLAHLAEVLYLYIQGRGWCKDILESDMTEYEVWPSKITDGYTPFDILIGHYYYPIYNEMRTERCFQQRAAATIAVKNTEIAYGVVPLQAIDYASLFCVYGTKETLHLIPKEEAEIGKMQAGVQSASKEGLSSYSECGIDSYCSYKDCESSSSRNLIEVTDHFITDARDLLAANLISESDLETIFNNKFHGREYAPIHQGQAAIRLKCNRQSVDTPEKLIQMVIAEGNKLREKIMKAASKSASTPKVRVTSEMENAIDAALQLLGL